MSKKLKTPAKQICSKGVKILSALFALAPFAVKADEAKPVLNEKFISSSEAFQSLLPGQKISVSIGVQEYAIYHSVLTAILNKLEPGNENLPIGIRIHEESKTIDFSSLDHITIRIPLDRISEAPPNLTKVTN